MDLIVNIIPLKLAKIYILKNHYMHTWANSVINFGIFKDGKLEGVITFGYNNNTEKKIRKIIPNIAKHEFIEMQRMYLSDYLVYNSESHVLSVIIRLLRNKGLKAIITHAGGCKNDCGIVYQASSWLYFGKERCNDFYLTKDGKYKNIIAAIRYGRVPSTIKKPDEIGRFLFGEGQLIKSFRYTYIYPIQKGLRKYLERKCMLYPKDSKNFSDVAVAIDYKKGMGMANRGFNTVRTCTSPRKYEHC